MPVLEYFEKFTISTDAPTDDSVEGAMDYNQGHEKNSWLWIEAAAGRIGTAVSCTLTVWAMPAGPEVTDEDGDAIGTAGEWSIVDKFLIDEVGPVGHLLTYPQAWDYLYFQVDSGSFKGALTVDPRDGV